MRYKTDVMDVDEDWRRVVRALRPITYRSRAPADDPSRRWYGLIAEEVSEIEPQLVHYTRDDVGNDLPDSVQYDRLAVILLKAVQELLKITC
jgi:hypothetical protein